MTYWQKKALYWLLGTPLVADNPLYHIWYRLDALNKIPNLEGRPRWLTIETTNRCNVSCNFCAHKVMQRKAGTMTDTLYRSLIHQAAGIGIDNVILTGFGEPLMDKHIISRIKQAKEAGVKFVLMGTNGILLDQDKAKGLLDSGLDHLCISIDSVAPQSYSRIHNCSMDNYHKVYSNVDHLIRLREQRRLTKPTIEVRFKDLPDNQGERGNFVKRWKNLADNITLYMNIFNWPLSGMDNSLPKGARLHKFPCYNLWIGLHVMYDGQVALCCQDYDCREPLGDAHTESLREIWFGSKLRHFRDHHINNNFECSPVCGDCIINTQMVNPMWGKE